MIEIGINTNAGNVDSGNNTGADGGKMAFMNSDVVKGTLKEILGKIKETGEEITDNDMVRFKGKREELAGLLMKNTGKPGKKRSETSKPSS